MKKMIFATICFSSLALISQAQDKSFKMPTPSPSTTIQQDFSTSSIEIEYSRPSMRNRSIFGKGKVVPYGTIWRTGANTATKITFGEDVSVNNIPVKAGSYSLYTIPNEKEWSVIINKNTENWGASGFDKKDDVAEFKVPVMMNKETTETFTIGIENLTNKSCDIVLRWENSVLPIHVTANNDKRIMDWLDQKLKSSKPPYQQAANYYLDNDKDLNLALDYASKAIAENPKASYLHWLKARIYDKMGKNTEALKEAKIAADAMVGTPYAIEYQNNYESLKNK